MKRFLLGLAALVGLLLLPWCAVVAAIMVYTDSLR